MTAKKQTYGVVIIGDSKTMSCVANSDIIFCNDENLLAVFREMDSLHGV